MKSEYLHIRINPILKEEATEAASSEGKTLSEWVTDLIKLAVETKKNKDR
jgi:predicted HicB family RNase H-like nuclease